MLCYELPNKPQAPGSDTRPFPAMYSGRLRTLLSPAPPPSACHPPKGSCWLVLWVSYRYGLLHYRRKEEKRVEVRVGRLYILSGGIGGPTLGPITCGRI